MKPHEFYLDIDFWDDYCLFVWPVTKESAEEWYKDKFNESENCDDINTSTAITFLGDNRRIIFFKEWNGSIENIAILAHECIHVANYILKDKKVKEDENSDEVLAYFVGYLMRHFLGAIKQIEGVVPADGQTVAG